MKTMLQTNKAIEYVETQDKLNNIGPVWLVKYIHIYFFFFFLIYILLDMQHYNAACLGPPSRNESLT